jgi:hypothetical protein
MRSPRLAAKRDLGGQVRPMAGNALHLERAAEGLNPVGEPPQARTPRSVGPTDTVVDDLDLDPILAGRHG